MNTMLAGVQTSPVQMNNRRELGLKAGDTVKVHQKIQDKGKTRIQVFEGIVLSRKHGAEPGATFTVRRVSSGVGIEKIFPLYSPLIDKIEIVKRAKVRRAKLYFIRDKVAKQIKRQMRRMRIVSMSSLSETEESNRIENEAKAAEAAEQAALEEADLKEKAVKEAEEEKVETKQETPTEAPESDEEKKTDETVEQAPAEDDSESSKEEDKKA